MLFKAVKTLNNYLKNYKSCQLKNWTICEEAV